MDLAEIRKAMSQARKKGLDPLGVLDRQGLLLTDTRRNELVREVAENLSDMIEKSSVTQLGCNPQPRTGMDMQHCIVAFIRRNFTTRGDGSLQ